MIFQNVHTQNILNARKISLRYNSDRRTNNDHKKKQQKRRIARFRKQHECDFVEHET